MRNIFKAVYLGIFTVLLTACGNTTKEGKGELNDKKVKLEKLKGEQKNLSTEIIALEKDIAKLDTTGGAKEKEKLVTLSIVEPGKFSHYIDLQGKIDAKNIAYVAPRGQGGTVKAIYVNQGQSVRKGQIILKLDDALARQGVAAAQQQIAGLESQVKLAQSIFERQQNLWKQNIGTEVQVLQAKTNAETIVSQLNAARANVRLAQEQVNLSNVYAEIGGVVDQMNVRVGEFFSPQSAAVPQAGIRIVNTSDLKVLVKVPENYLDRVRVGTSLLITLPEQNNDTLRARVNVVGKVIDPNTRAFDIEARIPTGKNLKPNQLAMVKIQDYASSTAISIPVNTLQNDEKGKFVMVAVKENGKMIARKRVILVGELYGDRLEVKNGLQSGDTLIVEGFQGLYDGQLITTAQV